MALHLTGLTILILLNLIVSIFLVYRDDLTKFQKVAQIIIVWIIPFVGAIVMWVYYRGQDKDIGKPDKLKFGGGSNDGIGG